MWKNVILLAIAVPTLLAAQSIPAGRWDVTSTAVDLVVPGAPGFLLRMMRGKSKTEHKCLTPDQAKAGIAALLAPDPKGQCRIDSVQIDKGRYIQTLNCPQKKGTPIRVSRSGVYDAGGFAGQLHMAGTTPKGAMSIKIDQRAVHVAGSCRG